MSTITRSMKEKTVMVESRADKEAKAAEKAGNNNDDDEGNLI